MVKQKKADKSPLKGLESVFDKLIARLPDNINVDAAKLTQMACAGGAAYIAAPTVLRAMLMAQASLTDIVSGEPADPQAFFDIYRKFWGLPTVTEDVGVTEDEEALINKTIDAMTEEQRLAVALAVAAIVPMTPDILKGIGEIVKGIGEVVPG